jgi:hypothetical protein
LADRIEGAITIGFSDTVWVMGGYAPESSLVVIILTKCDKGSKFINDLIPNFISVLQL